MNKKEKNYDDFSNVEVQRNFIIPEDFPEGPYGAPRGADTPAENNNPPAKEGQRHHSAFNYENKELHENLPRKYPGAHPTHDEAD